MVSTLFQQKLNQRKPWFIKRIKRKHKGGEKIKSEEYSFNDSPLFHFFIKWEYGHQKKRDKLHLRGDKIFS